MLYRIRFPIIQHKSYNITFVNWSFALENVRNTISILVCAMWGVLSKLIL